MSPSLLSVLCPKLVCGQSEVLLKELPLFSPIEDSAQIYSLCPPCPRNFLRTQDKLGAMSQLTNFSLQYLWDLDSQRLQHRGEGKMVRQCWGGGTRDKLWNTALLLYWHPPHPPLQSWLLGWDSQWKNYEAEGKLSLCSGPSGQCGTDVP